MSLQKVLEYLLQRDTQHDRKAFKTLHHCFRSLLEVMVDLKELLESSDSEDSESGSDSQDEGEEDDEEDDSNEVCFSMICWLSHSVK